MTPETGDLSNDFFDLRVYSVEGIYTIDSFVFC